MKLPHYQDYPPDSADKCEQVLLTVWSVLGDFHDDLVLVGGMVPRYLCKRNPGSLSPVTLDVDLGISLATSAGQYDTISVRLKDAGFALDQERRRFFKTFANITIYVDFLTEKSKPNEPSSRMVDDVVASAFLGVDRALQVFRRTTIAGKNLRGANVSHSVKICEAGPFLCLKLNAFKGRAQAKDIFDFVRCVQDYDNGPAVAAKLFKAEMKVNSAFSVAQSVLSANFSNEEQDGPLAYADFILQGQRGQLSDQDFDFYRQQYINDALSVGQLLISDTR